MGSPEPLISLQSADTFFVLRDETTLIALP